VNRGSEVQSEERFCVSVYEKCEELRVYSVSKSQNKFSQKIGNNEEWCIEGRKMQDFYSEG